jgi:predicted GIY-YIG superfamily endonuclease
MSNMLEQAIVDAQSLREAAMKSAEEAVVQKYSSEVKSAVARLLEQDDDVEVEPDEEVDSTAMEQVPLAHVTTESDDEIVEVNLDDILAAAAVDPPFVEDAIDAELDREEIADEVGLDLEDEESPANRSDELDLNEDELVNMFKEMLAVDVPDITLEQSEDELETDDLESDIESEYTLKAGMDEEDIEAHARFEAKNEAITKENQKLKNLLRKTKDKLEEINLQNARLLYANRVLQDTSLNEQQKNKIAELVANARSVIEAKMVYETLQKTMADSKQGGPKSLSEAVTRRSSVILGGNRKEERPTDKNPTYNRWATLAGTNN